VVNRPLPAGLVNPSVTQPNVADPDTLVRELKALGPSFMPRTVALSLPDQCASMAVFPFESLPAGQKEREAILQWRFQNDRHVAVGDSTISARVFPVPFHLREELSLTGLDGPIACYVVATAVKRSILEQYRNICEDAGLFPVSIGVGSMQLFELTRPVMTSANESLFAALAADSGMFVGLRHGIPIFLRYKRRRSRTNMKPEILAMLQFIDSHYPNGNVLGVKLPSTLYIVEGQLCGDGQVEEAPSTLIEHAQWNVHLVRPTFTRTERRQRVPITSWGELCALASTAAA
jgi:hypothetical protein